MVEGDLNIQGSLLDLPRHSVKILTNFGPMKSTNAKDPIQNFYLALRLMSIQHEYIACIVFPFTFENKVATWCYNFPIGSITN